MSGINLGTIWGLLKRPQLWNPSWRTWRQQLSGAGWPCIPRSAVAPEPFPAKWINCQRHIGCFSQGLQISDCGSRIKDSIEILARLRPANLGLIWSAYCWQSFLSMIWSGNPSASTDVKILSFSGLKVLLFGCQTRPTLVQNNHLLVCWLLCLFKDLGLFCNEKLRHTPRRVTKLKSDCQWWEWVSLSFTIKACRSSSEAYLCVGRTHQRAGGKSQGDHISADLASWMQTSPNAAVRPFLIGQWTRKGIFLNSWCRKEIKVFVDA